MYAFWIMPGTSGFQFAATLVADIVAVSTALRALLFHDVDQFNKKIKLNDG
jgi:hypothetical protein